ncbi:MAG: M23 family metallopeptidase [Bacteroidales bacterium]|nr:M23 family metallopeptidase [Bacteroidales bacterium]
MGQSYLNKAVIFRAFIITLVLFTNHYTTAQELPQGYFASPLKGNISLSASFAECRIGHFHGGLDMLTGGAVDKPVYAAADGYISRVSISPWGGGKILYIKHPNGYTSVYMHLNSFVGKTGRLVREEQYNLHSYSIVKDFPEGQLPVRKGQLVAYSGNTGGGGGPHLHFELRKTATSHTINPLRFGLPYSDSMKPTIRGLRIYPTAGGQPIDITDINNLTVSSPFYIGIYATDAAEGSTPKNGADHIEVMLDGNLFFLYTTESFNLDSSRIINALVDYPHFAAKRQAYILTRALPGAEGEWIPVRQGDGIFRLEPGTTHRIQVRVYDFMDNCTERTITVTMAANATTASDFRPMESGDYVDYTRPATIRRPAFCAEMPAYTLYANDLMHCSFKENSNYFSPLCTIEPSVNSIPPHQYYKLSLRGKVPTGIPAGQITLVRLDGKRLVAYKTTYSDGAFCASVRDFGTFALTCDTIAPKVSLSNYKEGNPLKARVLRVKITDNLAGIETYNCYLNGAWVLAEYDAKSASLSIDTHGLLHKGQNELRVEVTDACGNLTRRSFTISR